MPRAIDLTGQVFGRLTVTGPSVVVPRIGRGRCAMRMPCRCACGVAMEMTTSQLRHEKLKSCGGCGTVPHPNIKHGHARALARSPTYRIWHGILQRCYAPKAAGFDHYGGRGITVCERWRHDFAAFLADMGERPAGRSIDRINGDGNYEPGNCRWATPKEQSRNTSSNRLVTFNGETLPVVVWAERLGAGGQLIAGRIGRGWSIERAVTERVGKYSRRAA